MGVRLASVLQRVLLGTATAALVAAVTSCGSTARSESAAAPDSTQRAVGTVESKGATETSEPTETTEPTPVAEDDNGSFDPPVDPCPDARVLEPVFGSGVGRFDLMETGTAHDGRDWHCKYEASGLGLAVYRMDLYVGNAPDQRATGTGPDGVPELGPGAGFSGPLGGCPDRTDSGRRQVSFPRIGAEGYSALLVLFGSVAATPAECQAIKSRAIEVARIFQENLPA
jgi:hypothetical protein